MYHLSGRPNILAWKAVRQSTTHVICDVTVNECDQSYGP